MFCHRHLEVVDEYVYLGVVFNYNGSFTEAIDKQLTQGKKAYYALLSKVYKLRLPVDISLEMFNYLVLPVLLYGCKVWGYSNIEHIEILYRNRIKTLLKVNMNTPNVMVYGETGTFPIVNHINIRIINFYARIVSGKQTKLSFILYKLTRKKQELENMYNSKWLNMIESNLAFMGMNDLWLNEGMGFYPLYIKEAFKRRQNDSSIQDWKADVVNHDYCDVYNHIKSVHGFEKYLNSLSYFHRIALGKWRCRSNMLPIAQSRYEINDSILCPFCPDVIGDEYHYMFNCAFFMMSEKNFYQT